MQDIKELSIDAILPFLDAQAQSPVVTMYIPTHRSASPPHMSEDQIRAKNLIRTAIDLLSEKTDTASLVAQIQGWYDAIASERAFWEAQTEGLLLLANKETIHLFHLPIDTEEYVAVDAGYHLAPVLGLLREAAEYYVLLISQHEPRVYEGSSSGLHDSRIPLPESIEKALQIDEVGNKGEQQRSAGSSATGFNGRGGERDQDSTDRIRFWRLIDEQLNHQLENTRPMLLVGTASEISEYRDISHYPLLLDHALHGNFTEMNATELFPLIAPIIRQDIVLPVAVAAKDRYERAKGQAPEQAVQDLDKAYQAAEAGRVESLLLANVRYTTDTVRDNLLPVPVLSFPKGSLAQKVQSLARMVWQNGGRIISLDEAAMPEPGALAVATLRY